MLKRILSGASLMLLAGCGTISPPSFDDICRDAANCSRSCGTVATGASPDCEPWENEGRTRG